MITFRNCRDSDLPIVDALVRQLYVEDPHLCNVKPDLKLTFDELFNHPDKGQIVVFENGQAVIGYAIMIFFWSNEYRGNIIEVDELCVDHSQRGKGISTEFFAWLEREFVQKAVGCSLQVAHSNDGAARLYGRLGFKRSRNQHLLKML